MCTCVSCDAESPARLPENVITSPNWYPIDGKPFSNEAISDPRLHVFRKQAKKKGAVDNNASLI